MYQIKKSLCLVILSLFFSGSLLAMEHDPNDDLLKGRYYIKSKRFNLYMSVSYKEGDEKGIIKVYESVSSASVFIFEKNEEGILIMNPARKHYLYVAGPHRERGRIVDSYESIMSGSYFKILKKDQGNVIKNEKWHDYLHVANTLLKDNSRDVKYEEYIDENSYFIFEPCKQELF
ncbi:MAG: hypothetical protein BGO67_07645 [Alphaproteobacteria bacterium 41-28]|nr:MAG: hypothetical protein BGO67_07645 [Alphaproteobacteria bacterium 41-28]